MSAILPVYRRSDIAIERGEGAYLFAPDGRRYLDFAAGIAVNALGHCHPHVTAALKTQADLLWHCSNMYRIPGLEKLAERFVQATFADRAFFCNSGSEAVECGFKMIRKYHDHSGNPERFRIITMSGGFHGRTLSCISAGGNDIARKGFEPLVDGFDRVEYNNLAATQAAITPLTAGILVEPIQGEGGVKAATDEFLQGLRALCDQHGLLLMIDEVQCGMGRTGSLFAHEQAGITPDLVTVAKGIGNGFPLAACLATERAASGMTPGSHGSTYGSNPLAMAVGNAVLDVLLAPGFLEQVAETGRLLKTKLQSMVAQFPTLLSEVRGTGLMLGLKTVVPCREMVEQLRAFGLLTVPSEDNVIRITPPLIITSQHIDEAIGLLTHVCKEWK
ncbi:MAG: aspartate aminotransferase family protein [Rickettsiales bacterium]|nr:aspartate aminotransferase family protein [Rickettsiales bacterium]